MSGNDVILVQCPFNLDSAATKVSLGMQRAGKFPGIFETFHGKFREFWRVGNFWKFWEFSILTYFLHFMRFFVPKLTKLNSFCTNYPRYWFCITIWSIESTTRLHNELIYEFFIWNYIFVFHVIFRISNRNSKLTNIKKKKKKTTTKQSKAKQAKQNKTKQNKTKQN